MPNKESVLPELWDLVRSIPPGRVASYGDLGRSLSRPVSGFLVGRWMAAAPADVPWWRVVGKQGDLKVAKRDPHLAREQLAHLRSEGVEVSDGRVRVPDDQLWAPEQATA